MPKLYENVFPHFANGAGAFYHADGYYAVAAGADCRWGPAIPGPREVVDLPGIAAGFRVRASVRHNDVMIRGATNGTDTKLYRKQAATARQFTAASSEYFTRADNATLSAGDIHLWVAAWVYLDALGTDRAIASKWTAGQLEWRLAYEAAGNTVYFEVSSNGSAAAASVATAAIAAAGWYFVLAWHDPATNTINIKLNNATTVTTSTSGGIFDGTGAFEIGRIASGNYWNGRIGPVGFWKPSAAPTAAEATALYNSGVALRSGQLASVTTPTAYWNMDEASGDAVDSVGSNNLTDTNTVTTATANYNHWAIKQTISSAVITPNGLASYHDGTNSTIVVCLGNAVAFRYSVDDLANIVTSTKTGDAKYADRAMVQQNELGEAVVTYVKNPNQLYRSTDMTNTGDVTTLSRVGDGSSQNYFTSLSQDPGDGMALLGMRHSLFKFDGVNSIEVAGPFPDPPQDAGGQGDRLNFECVALVNGRLYYNYAGFEIGEWFRGQWNGSMAPKWAGPLIPVMNQPINAMVTAGEWLIAAMGSESSATYFSGATAPGGAYLEQNAFNTSSDLWAARYQPDPDTGQMVWVWHGSLLTVTAANSLRLMDFDEDDSMLYLASGGSRAIDVQQTRCQFLTVDPRIHQTGAAVILQTGTWLVEMGRIQNGDPLAPERLVSIQAKTTNLGTPSLAVSYKASPDYEFDAAAPTTLVTWTSDAEAERGCRFPQHTTYRSAVIRFHGSGAYAYLLGAKVLSEEFQPMWIRRS